MLSNKLNSSWKWLVVSGSSIAGCWDGSYAIAQNDSPPKVTIPADTPNLIELKPNHTRRRLIDRTPGNSKTPTLQTPDLSKVSDCPVSNTGERFFVKKIEVLGNTVLKTEIDREVNKLTNRYLSFEDLICLRSKITTLYLSKGYITSGAFLRNNNQSFRNGIVQIQVVEGEVEKITIRGLKRLRQDYVRSRLQLSTNTPLNRQNLEDGLKLLLIDPLIARLRAELTAGNTPGKNILILDIEESPTFKAGIGADNYRPVSVGSTQANVFASQDNLLGFGDRLAAEYGVTEGLDLYNINYSIPFNSYNGTLNLSYDNSDSQIIESRFRNLNIKSNTKTFSVNFRQPIYRKPNTEFAFDVGLDLRRSKSFLDGEPFSFSEGAKDGKANITALRFSQDWLHRNANTVLAVRSQFSFGIDAFNATINNKIGTDSQFVAWLGQFQWVQRLSQETVLVTKINGQLTPDSLLSIEKFSLGGMSTVRGYRENLLVTDNGFSGSIEVRIPLTSNPNTLQISPFFEVGTGWNNREPDPPKPTLASLGVSLNWLVTDNFGVRLDYGIPLVAVENDGESLQENGLQFSLRYQPF